MRATHHFLAPADLLFYKTLIPGFFTSVHLTAARDGQGHIIAFLGTADRNIEMLFVHPDDRGTGIGTLLIRHAVEELGCRCVDVNEQNTQAIGFYEHLSFRQVGRSDTDPTGKPYPILHLVLDGQTCPASE